MTTGTFVPGERGFEADLPEGARLTLAQATQANTDAPFILVDIRGDDGMETARFAISDYGARVLAAMLERLSSDASEAATNCYELIPGNHPMWTVITAGKE